MWEAFPILKKHPTSLLLQDEREFYLNTEEAFFYVEESTLGFSVVSFHQNAMKQLSGLRTYKMLENSEPIP